MENYSSQLLSATDNCYSIAKKARAMGYDPELYVEIPIAEDMAARVESLVGPKGIADRIRNLSKNHNRDEVSIAIAKEVVHRAYKSYEDGVYQAIRTALAILTEGVLVAPLEGVTGVKIDKNNDGSSYLAVQYAGPIRSAGGTAQAMSVLIADIVRKEIGIGRYIPTIEEIERYVEEMPLYREAQHLQYTPTKDEVEYIVKNCPICIDGEGTEEIEVSGYRDLPRVATNRVRGGACLVIAEGICQKAAKLQKYVKMEGMEDWNFINKLARRGGEEETHRIKYMEDLIAGRPVLSHPSRVGGFRLRYGRTRASGLAALSIHPAAMALVDEFLAIGTQIKIEGPGKAGIVTSCEKIEPPIVLLKNGDLVEIEDVKTARELKDKIKTIVDLGEILIPYGEFLENNHPLMPGSYCKEWWDMQIKNSPYAIGEAKTKLQQCYSSYTINSAYNSVPTPEEAFELSEKYSVPLHPKYTLFWHDIKCKDILFLSNFIEENGKIENGSLILPRNEKIKEVLIQLGALHKERDGKLIFDIFSYPLLRCCGISKELKRVVEKIETNDPMALVSNFSGVKIMKKAPTRIGARMGRPEKAKERKMKPSPHFLFPLGLAGGAQRLLNSAVENKEINVDIGIRKCIKCEKKTISNICSCGNHTLQTGEIRTMRLNIKELLEDARKRINEEVHLKIKGVRGLTSIGKTPEPIEKGILRAKHDIYVFKDGTSRFDMTNAPLTHFKPCEINTSFEKVKELGYKNDYLGAQIENDSQIIELKPQDVIPSKSCMNYFLRVAKFIDDLLFKFYKIEPFYNLKNIDELVGHLVLGLSPHTSACVVGRIIGYTNASVCYAHPFFHSAKRRNCDGDEDCLMLLLDVFLNFSRSFLPKSRGGLMDAPLVLSTKINIEEIDKEAHNIDIVKNYPLEFYEATLKNLSPKEVENIVETVGKRIGKMENYENFFFTHDTDDIGEGVKASLYKKLKVMVEKLDAQLSLGEKIRAVDASDVASKVIEDHFLPDIIGNLKCFSKQSMRCTKCNAKYRRVPLSGKCAKCNGNLTLTVHEKSVRKYLEVAKKICEKYKVRDYTIQRLSITEKAINSLFENDKVKKLKLEDFI